MWYHFVVRVVDCNTEKCHFVEIVFSHSCGGFSEDKPLPLDQWLEKRKNDKGKPAAKPKPTPAKAKPAKPAKPSESAAPVKASSHPEKAAEPVHGIATAPESKVSEPGPAKATPAKPSEPAAPVKASRPPEKAAGPTRGIATTPESKVSAPVPARGPAVSPGSQASDGFETPEHRIRRSFFNSPPLRLKSSGGTTKVIIWAGRWDTSSSSSV